jgi:hypothetical protein
MQEASMVDDVQPSRGVIVFPMGKQIGHIRNAATKMLDKPTDRAAAFYRDQVTDALRKQLDRAGIPAGERDGHLCEFWQSVRAEMVRLTYCGYGTGEVA